MTRILFLLLFTGGLILEAHGQDVIIGKQYQVQSTILNEERQISIFVPQDYESNISTKYQVLYLLDGEWHFHYVSALVDKLVASGDLPNMIVVGINNNNRSKDLTPAGINDNPNRFGGAKRFLDFITQELKPWIEKNYRTHPYNVLAGHSFGGLFTLYSMMEKPDAFQAYLALSPSLGRNNEQQVKRAQNYFKKSTIFPKGLYLAIANEGGYTLTSSKKFDNIIKTNTITAFPYKFEQLLEESHSSITASGFLHGLKFLYQGINPENSSKLDEIFLMETHFQKLSKRFGYEIKVPEYYYQKFTKEQIGERELDYALFILEKYKMHYPKSVYILSYYADIYLLKGEFEKAKSYYLQLKTLGVENENLDVILKAIGK